MTSAAERRLNSRGLFLDEGTDLGRHDEPDIGGYLVLVPDESGAVVNAIVRRGVEAEFRAMFAEWVEQRIDRFFEHGPEPDGWKRRSSDGGWQLWARLVELPQFDQGHQSSSLGPSLRAVQGVDRERRSSF
ncbi:hypothetical protein [Micromonospora sp. SH-82]|uniref:hypothetical protein n=1 Tax=Micromonospora sp. SH-82 TaxID=3132938 RepID=UPI003EBE4B6D